MNPKKTMIIFLTILSILLISQNILGFELDQTVSKEITKIIQIEKAKNTENIEKLKKEFKKQLYQFNNLEKQLPESSIKIERSLKKPGFLSEKKFLGDVNYLFEIFKYGYSGYQYFGGEQKFNNVEKNIIKAVKEKSFFNFLSTKEFVKILQGNLSFIQDLHFAIDGKSVGNRYQYYMSSDYIFYKDKAGYYTNFEGQKAYIDKIQGGNIENFLKLSINKEGYIIYRLGKIEKVKKNNEIAINVVFKLEDDNSIDKKIKLIHPKMKYYQNKLPYHTYQKDGINIIEHRTASANKNNLKKLEKFASEAPKFKDDKFLIIDLRGNSGGADIYASDWVENFTGVEPGEGIIESSLVTDTANRLLLNSFNQMYGMQYSDLEGEYKKIFEKTKSGWTKIKYHPYKSIGNDTLIFVLIDNGVASAGESFVNYLKQLENNIFIGTNTAGLLSFGNMGMCNLPNSNIELFISKTISLTPDLKSREGYGYYPDFWVAPIDALDISLKFIDNYFIEE